MSGSSSPADKLGTRCKNEKNSLERRLEKNLWVDSWDTKSPFHFHKKRVTKTKWDQSLCKYICENLKEGISFSLFVMFCECTAESYDFWDFWRIFNWWQHLALRLVSVLLFPPAEKYGDKSSKKSNFFALSSKLSFSFISRISWFQTVFKVYR